MITGPVFEPSIAQSESIGPGHVHVPKYLFKLVYDKNKNRAWAHWHLNDDTTRGSRPISYAELVKRTGIGQNGLLKQLTKALVERALQAQFRSTSIGNRIPLVASIAIQAFSVKVLRIVEQAA